MTTKNSLIRCLAGVFAILSMTFAFISPASAETLMMPDRDALMGQGVVVWGVTNQVGGTYTLDCGNGDVDANVALADGSYITKVCTYGAQGTFTATLTSNTAPEAATVDVAVFDGTLLSLIDLRGVRINMAIEDGLRNLWTTQSSLGPNFSAAVTTNWGNNSPWVDASMVVLAFENHGYGLTNDNVAPTGLYQKYIVRRGLNYVMSTLSVRGLGVTPQGDDPCVGSGAGWNGSDCVGLQTASIQGYSVGIAMLGFAGSGALARVNTEVAGVTAGMTYGEILQRLTNALAWGQQDAGNVHRGGWIYSLNGGGFDGSTVGWAILGLLDAGAAGATVPPWVATEFLIGMNNAINTDGSFDYRADGNPASGNSVSTEKGGIPLQGMIFTGDNSQQASVATWISNHWNAAPSFCQFIGCAYTMFNNFKGLKLQGIQTLPGVGRLAGPGAIPADDWHEDYKDWLLANQSANGSWGPAMGFSCCGGARPNMETAIAELMLSPVALVLPDPVQFGDLGLQHCLDGAPCTVRTPVVVGDPTDDTNPVGTDHTIVARALSVTGSPIPGTTIDIDILLGPNSPVSFQGVSDANGEVQITYNGAGGPGTDEIQASIGNLLSNDIQKNWAADEVLMCDVSGDGAVDIFDIRAIMARRGQQAGPDDPADANGNGIIGVDDGRLCVLQCTLPRCAPVPQ